MKLLIPVLLLTLIAVGSSIVKVSERGARTAQADLPALVAHEDGEAEARVLAFAGDAQADPAKAERSTKVFYPMLADDARKVITELNEVFSDHVAHGTIQFALQDGKREGTAVLTTEIVDSALPILRQAGDLMTVLYVEASATDGTPIPPKKVSELRRYELRNRDVKSSVEAVTRLLQDEIDNNKMAVVGNYDTKTLYVAGAPGALERVAPFIETAVRSNAAEAKPAASATPKDAQGKKPISILLKYTDPADVAKALYDLYPDLNDRGVMISADGGNRTLWIRADEGSAAMLMEAVERMEANAKSQRSESNAATAQTKLIKLEKTKASTMKELLQTLYPDVVVQLAADDRSNTLLIRASGTQLNEFEAVIMRLEESPSQGPVPPARTNANPAEAMLSAATDPPVDRQQLAQTFRELDQKAAALADEIRDWHAQDSDTEAPQIAELTPQLRAAVTQAFEARQRWQIAELAVLRARLERLDREIKSREQAKLQIIEHRTWELIEGKAEESDASVRQRGRDASATSPPASPLTSTGGALSSSSGTVHDSVRTALLKKIAEAEVELAMARINAQEQREKSVNVSTDYIDMVLEPVVQNDPEIKRLNSLIDRSNTQLGSINPQSSTGKRVTSKLSELKNELESRKAQLRSSVESQSGSYAADLERGHHLELKAAEGLVKTKQRHVELLKEQLREREESGGPAPVLPFAVTESRSSRPAAGADDSVRTFLLDQIAKAEVDLWRTEIKAQEAHDVQDGKAPEQYETKLGYRFAADPEVRRLRKSIGQLKGEFNASKPGTPAADDLKQKLIVLESELESRIAELRPTAEQSLRSYHTELVNARDREVRLKERAVELLKQQLHEREAAGPSRKLPFSNLDEHEDATPHRDSVNRDQYRRAATVWMTDPEAAKARAKELKRPLLVYIDLPTKSLDLESQKEWMALPEVLDLLEKSFVAVRTGPEAEPVGDEAQSFPYMTIVDLLSTKPGVEVKLHAGIAKFHYDKRFLDLLHKIAAEYEGVSVTEGPKRTAPDTANESSRAVDQETEGSAASLRDRLLAAQAEVETATASVNKARAALALAVAAYNTSVALKPGDDVVEARKAAVSAAEKEAARAATSLQTKKKRAGLLEDELRVRVRLLELDLSDSEARLQKAKADADRAQSLVERGAATRTALEDEQFKLKQAESAVERAKIQLDLYRRAIVPISSDESKSKAAAKPGEPPVVPDAESSNPGAATPRKPPEIAGAVVGDGDDLLPGASRPKPNPYKYDKGAYGWLRGRISKDNASRAWRLQYIDRQGEGDLFGGSLQLTGSPKLDELVEDDVVYVKGKIDSAVKDRDGRPLYRVESLDILKPRSN